MRKIVLYSAISLDDFIARKDGSIDWLENENVIPAGEDFGYGDFSASVDTTIMGNSTYKQIMGFGGDFPYPDKKNFVITTKKDVAPTKYVEFISGDIQSFCRELKEKPGRDIWLVGGGEINTLLLQYELIDQLILTRIPIPIGNGIPLFHSEHWKSDFNSASTKMFGKGVIQIIMDRKS